MSDTDDYVPLRKLPSPKAREDLGMKAEEWLYGLYAELYWHLNGNPEQQRKLGILWKWGIRNEKRIWEYAAEARLRTENKEEV